MAGQIHRFRDCLGLHLGEGRTLYLTPDAARKIGAALIAGAEDIKALPFVLSGFRSREIAGGTAQYPHGFTVAREGEA